MDRRIEIKKIVETTKRQVAFSKRRTCLLKKVKEIAICYDVDMLFVAFSPANRLSKFCSPKRIKDMLQRYIELPVERILTHMTDVQAENVSELTQVMIENLELQIKKSTLESQILDANIRSFDSVSQMELEKQEKMDVDFVAQQTTPHQFDTNNWTNPYSSNIQESILQYWMNEGKEIAKSSGNYAYSPSFPSSSQNGNIPFFQSQNSSPYISLQNQQQNIMIDVHENPTQAFGQLQNQEQNMMVDFQQSPTQIFGQSQAQMTFGNDNSLFNFWQNICDSTRSVSCTQLNSFFQLGLENDNTTWNNNLNNSSSFGLENAHSNWNNNMSNNNNYINEYNDPPSVQSDAITHNVNGFNYSMEENTMGNIAESTTHENDACEWEVFLNEAFNGEDC
ncbi:MADS-box protein 04g005320-like [Solanum lycopersicum]|uniref:MADS-box protein 04g005320-like n=1 Tax=Solanum lycopersicum TaxID=4081 RepID=UPI003748B843